MFRRLNLQNVQRHRDTRFIFYLFGAFGVAAILLRVFNIALLGVFLAIFRRNCLPTRHSYGPLCADDPFDAGIKQLTVCVGEI
jgi:hypothetical protein